MANLDSKTIFLLLFAYRLALALIARTAFEPDEYWQSLETAHRMVFGYGEYTWEWLHGIRSVTYPLLFAIQYYFLYYFKLDHTMLLIYFPKVFQAAIAALIDYYTWRLGIKYFGADTGYTALLVSIFNFFNGAYYTRTFSNTMECLVFLVFLDNWKWKSSNSKYQLFLIGILIGFGVSIRPTISILLIYPLVYYLFSASRKFEYIFCLSLSFILYTIVQLLVDSAFYGKITFVPYEFVMFNFVKGSSSFYGVHSFFWYFTGALPVLCAEKLIFLIPSILKNMKHPFTVILLLDILFHSLLSHKESRFLLPLSPVFCILIANFIQGNKSKLVKFVLYSGAVFNLLAILYLGLFHQKGGIEVIHFLRTEAASSQQVNLLFLTPCHTTPMQSILHAPIKMKYLTCNPHLEGLDQ